MGTDWNLLVSDAKFLLKVESTALLYCMVFRGKKYYSLYILLFSDKMIKEENTYLMI